MHSLLPRFDAKPAPMSMPSGFAGSVLMCRPGHGQVSLLDPVSYPGAIKAFAREVCRNDLLNFGRLHFFFPDSRLALDLNTDRTLKVGSLSVTPSSTSS